ncbi:hypothetical protein EMPS_06066 [Entomortierella parvispora]|uniref:EB domain-containing protein n=1 Tax=Entomortierella parvispora TaxID=205924 RepID=A0A9P3HC30_9FUNG|nr:hypothetical protein EMPS_06066 [Entomortierella parvispora]
MVQLSLPLIDNDGDKSQELQDLNCDETESIYDRKHCIKNALFCSHKNPCPSNIDCIDGVCQCLPNEQQFISLTPPPVRLFSLGCNFDTARVADSCRSYEYGVDKTCLLNYCSNDIPCYAGTCDPLRHVCVNMNSTRLPLPPSRSQVVSLGNDPFGVAHQENIFSSPILVVLLAAVGVLAVLLIVGIFRLIHRSVKTSVTWASRGHRLTSTDDLHFDDKDGHVQELDRKYSRNELTSEPALVNMTSRNIEPIPSSSRSHHSTSYSPTYPPTIFHDKQVSKDRFPSYQQETGPSTESIELAIKDPSNDSTTAELQQDPNHKSQSEENGLSEPKPLAQHVDPAQVPSPHSPSSSPLPRAMAWHQSVSHGKSLKAREPGLYKSPSAHVRGSKTLSQILPPAPYPPFTSMPLPPTAESYGAPVPRKSLNVPKPTRPHRNAQHLTLLMPPPPTYPPPGSTSASTTPRTSPISFGYPPASPFHSAGYSPSSGRSTPTQRSRSFCSGGWSRHRCNGAYANYPGPEPQLSPSSMFSSSQISLSPAARNLPAGFASSPVAKTAERFD